VGEGRHLEGWTHRICFWVAELGDGRWLKVTYRRRVRSWVDLVFDKRVGHGRAQPWPDYLGPVGERSNLFERCRWAEQSIDPSELEPCNDWLPVSLWLGTPGLLTQVDVEALIFLFGTFGGDAGVELTRMVWCRESATKTKQTIWLTVSVREFGIGSVVWHGFEDVKS
jgi:hypothetical protein